jgi:hypothetical protein
MMDLGDGIGLIVRVGLNTTLSGYALWDVALFDSATWGPDDVWVDLSDRVLSFECSARYPAGMRGWTAASFSCTFNNNDGDLSDENTSSPYYNAGLSSIIPGRPFQALLTYAGLEYAMITGYVNEWAEGYVLFGPHTGTASITASGADAWQRIAAVKATADLPLVGSGEHLGARMLRLLSYASFSGGIDVDTGYVEMQETSLSDDPAVEIETTAASEGGFINIDPDGKFVARDRYALVEDPRSITVQQTLSNSGAPGEIVWHAISKSPKNLGTTINAALYTRVDGTQQAYRDQTSIALYGEIADQAPWVDKLMCATDPDVYALCVWTVISNCIPASKVESVTIKPKCDVDTLMPVVLDAQYRDLWEIIVSPPSDSLHTVTRDCFVSGKSWRIENGDITVEIFFESAGAYRQFALSRWDVGLFGDSDADPAGARFFI